MKSDSEFTFPLKYTYSFKIRKMSDTRHKELINAEELGFNGKVEESLEIIRNYERVGKKIKGNISYF